MDEHERDELLVRIDERVQQVHKAVYGNGQPGALNAIAVLQTEMEQVKGRAPTKFERFAGGGVVVTLVVSVIAKFLGIPVPV